MKTTLWLAAGAAGMLLLLQGCNTRAEVTPAKAEPPAKVENRVKENDLTRVTLTEQAAQRLGIRIARAEAGELSGEQTVIGEIVPIPGAAIQVQAPVAGTVLAPGGGLRAGQRVNRGERVFLVRPLAGVQRDLRVTLETDLQAAQARLDAAEQQLQRARKLLAEQAGSRRDVEAAEREFRQAQAAQQAAAQRVDQVRTRPLDADVEMAISAPISGIVRQIFAVPGQSVAGGAPLFEVVDLSRVWIRVPVYAGEIGAVGGPGKVLVRSVSGNGAWRTATRTAAPPTADPLAVTADLYFELPNADGALRPGERLSVQLPERGAAKRAVGVPSGALLYDVNGGAWVYVAEQPRVFRRQRVELLQTAGGTAWVTRGLASGTAVVAEGAAELFGTEFGAGK